jgi:transcriptional regulator with XRE-family HTH domain
MPESALGYLLKKLREQRGLSLRELARMAEVDHAYIYRLETGDKGEPSADILKKLTRSLKPAKREADMLQFLAQSGGTSPELVELTLQDPTISFNVFTGVAGLAFRGKRPNYAELIARVRRWEEDEADG